MTTFTQIFYHIVFSTKNRERVLKSDRRNDLYRHIGGIIKYRNSHLYRINGISDHVHILSSLHPSVSLADFIKEIKLGSAHWIKDNDVFPGFSHWQDGYGSFTCSFRERDGIIEYIKNQEEHHLHESFIDEYRRLLINSGVEFQEKYLI